MKSSYFFTAIGTPLTEDESLCKQGLEQELAEQKSKGYEGILVAGSMGCMQLLKDETYRSLIKNSIKFFDGEILVGAGDCGYARTTARIEYLNTLRIDGVAVLAPYFWKLNQNELVDYYKSLADISRAPIYLYDLPQVTGTKMSLETCISLSKHSNIAGAKLSCSLEFSRELNDHIGDRFRIIIAQPDLVDMALKFGFRNQLDGIWTITPGWAREIRLAAEKNDWERAAVYVRKMIQIRRLLVKYGWASFTNMMNARGIEGYFVGKPFQRLDSVQCKALLHEPAMQALVMEDSIASYKSSSEPGSKRLALQEIT